MKKLVFFLALLPSLLWAQTSSLSTLVQRSAADSNATSITVSGKAFDLMSHVEPDTIITENVMKLVGTIHGMEAFLDLSPETGASILAKLSASKTLEEYTKVVHNQEIYALFIQEKEGVVAEAIFIAKQKTGTSVASIYGEIDLALIGELIKAMPFQQFHKMAKE